MNEDTLIRPLRQLGKLDDPLTEIAREGAWRMLAEMLKAEADAFVAKFSDERLGDGRQRVVRHGFGPERRIQTGIGPLDGQRPKVRDPLPGSRMPAFDERGAAANTPDIRIRFTSNVLPKWARRSVSLDALLTVLTDSPHAFVRPSDAVLSWRVTPDTAGLPPARLHYVPPDPKLVDLSFAGRLRPGDPSLAAIAAARPGDPIHLIRDRDRKRIYYAEGQTLTRLSETRRSFGLQIAVI